MDSQAYGMEDAKTDKQRCNDQRGREQMWEAKRKTVLRVNKGK